MSERPPAAEIGELRLVPESIEALAMRLAELLGSEGPPESSASPKQQLTAAEVSEWWGVGRRWVYDHATELGARRLGAGPRPRLRFDPDEVAERLGAPRPLPGVSPDRRRLTAISANRHSDSLSGPRRANVGGQGNQAAGRRGNAPGPAPKEVHRRDHKPSPAGPSRHYLLAADPRGGGS